MASTFDKLNLKDQKLIVVVNAPESFEKELAGLSGVAVKRSDDGAAQIEFSLAFVTKQNEVDSLAKSLGGKARGDAVVWSRIRREVPRSTNASSTGTPGGTRLANRGLSRCAWWRSTRTCRPCGSGAWNSSRS